MGLEAGVSAEVVADTQGRSLAAWGFGQYAISGFHDAAHNAAARGHAVVRGRVNADFAVEVASFHI